MTAKQDFDNATEIFKSNCFKFFQSQTYTFNDLQYKSNDQPNDLLIPVPVPETISFQSVNIKSSPPATNIVNSIYGDDIDLLPELYELTQLLYDTSRRYQDVRLNLDTYSKNIYSDNLTTSKVNYTKIAKK